MTLVVTHSKVSTKPVGNDSTRIYSDSWNANHVLTGTSDASQLNANVVQAVVNDTNIQGSIAAQTLTFSWGGTLAAARLNANVVQGITNDTNVTGSISAQNLTLGWTGQLGLSRGGTNADLSATGGAANYLKQSSIGAALTVGTIPASDIASGTALTSANDTNVTITLGGTPATALLKATSLTMGWSGTLAASRGGFGSDISAQSGVPLFASGVPTFTSTSGSGNFVRVTSPTLVTPALGTPSSGTLTNCTGLPLTGLATEASYTLVGNVTGSTASPTAFTIDGLTLKGTPASTDEVIIWDVAGAAIKKATVSSIGSSSGVTSIASNTGAFTLAGGVTNSTNQIQLDGNYTGFAVPNCTLAASVASNILTVALKDNAGNDPSATSPVYINYRNVTASTGSTTLVSQTAALSITTNATGATLGSSNNTAFRFWVVAFNNSGTNVLALINCSNSTTVFPLNESAVASSTAMSGSATSAGVFYTPNGTTVTSKAFRILGYIEYNSTGLATAGTYATGPNFIQTFGPGIRRPGETVQKLYFTTNSSTATTSSTFSASANTLSISPTSAANPISIRAQATTLVSGAATAINSEIRRGASTVIGNVSQFGFVVIRGPVSHEAFDLPNTTSSTSYTVYIASNDNATSVTYNIANTITATASMVVEEIMG